MSYKLAHISDVHWRSLKRHDEYKKVFVQLFKKLEKEKPDVIFIGGDIVHSKTQGISPEIIENLNWWFNSLADIAPTHVILGNHDGLILNEDRQDAITPIINAMNNENIFLYKKSGVYPTGLDNINWCVFSCFDQKNWNNVRPVEGQINIACFHGAVFGSKTDVDWELEGEVGLSFFQDYDFVFLGDIHKFQYLDEEKRVVYPGSTIQQNYGEDIAKGFVMWEINNKHDFKNKFIKIANPHPFVTIDWQNTIEDTILFCDKVKKEARFRIRSNTQISQAEIKILHHYLKNDKNAHEIVYQVLNNNDISTSNIEISNEINTLDIRKKSDRNKILESYYNGLDESSLLQLDEVFVEKLDKIPKDLSDVRGQKWSINSMKFNNTFSYGKNNYINFNNLNGVVGLFGNNRTGKSSIPGTLMYTLFNTTDRGAIKNQDIVNIRKGSCNSTINFNIGTEVYEITRETTKKTNKKGITSATTSLALKNLSDANNFYDESEEQRRETEKILRKIIGTSEDFLYTSFASQGEMNTFIKEKSSARKTVLSKFLNLEIFEELYKNSREDYIVLKNKLKSIKEENWSGLIEENQNQIQKNKEDKLLFQEKINALREKEIDLKLQQKELEKSIKTHPSGHNVDSVKEKIDFLSSSKEKLEVEILSYNTKIDTSKEKLLAIDTFKKSYPIEDLENDKDKLDKLILRINDFKTKKESYKKDFRSASNELKILNDVPCNDEYPTCKFIKKAHEAKGNIPLIEKEIKEIETSIYEVRDVVAKLESENISEKIKKYNDILKKEYKLKVDIENFKIKKQSFIEKLDTTNASIQKFTDLSVELKNFSDDASNKKTKEIKTEINEVSDSISYFERKIYNNSHDLFELEKEIENIEKRKKEYNDLIQQWKICDLFSNAVSKKGIPTMLIKTCLPRINKEIENILHGVASFKIEISDEENNNNLNVYIDYGDSKRIIECASGMEKMIASIAIRVALINISSLPKSDIFIIDEGFGALDDSNIEACGRLLNSLKKYFKSIIIISHIDGIKDIVDKNIEITVKGQDSYVEYK